MIAAVTRRDGAQGKNSMEGVQQKLAERFDGTPPDGGVIKNWHRKLINTGALNDRMHTGRPSVQCRQRSNFGRVDKFSDQECSHTLI